MKTTTKIEQWELNAIILYWINEEDETLEVTDKYNESLMIVDERDIDRLFNLINDNVVQAYINDNETKIKIELKDNKQITIAKI